MLSSTSQQPQSSTDLRDSFAGSVANSSGGSAGLWSSSGGGGLSSSVVPDSLAAVHHRVICDGCGAKNFTGVRHKCLICPDYDLCATCALNGATSKNHDESHLMQPIASPNDYEIYFGDGGSAKLGLSSGGGGDSSSTAKSLTFDDDDDDGGDWDCTIEFYRSGSRYYYENLHSGRMEAHKSKFSSSLNNRLDEIAWDGHCYCWVVIYQSYSWKGLNFGYWVDSDHSYVDLSYYITYDSADHDWETWDTTASSSSIYCYY